MDARGYGYFRSILTPPHSFCSTLLESTSNRTVSPAHSGDVWPHLPERIHIKRSFRFLIRRGTSSLHPLHSEFCTGHPVLGRSLIPYRGSGNALVTPHPQLITHAEIQHRIPISWPNRLLQAGIEKPLMRKHIRSAQTPSICQRPGRQVSAPWKIWSP